MNRILLLSLLTLVFFLALGTGSANALCIDQEGPSIPGSLVITDSPYDADGNIALSWGAATDTPPLPEPCVQGVSGYLVYRGNTSDFEMNQDTYLDQVSGLTYDDLSSLPEGAYYYKVVAVDMAYPGNTGPAAQGSTTVGQAPTPPITPGGNGGGGGGGYTPSCTVDWSCTAWTSCADGKQTRTCTDLNGCGTTGKKPIETQTCIVVGGGDSDTCETGEKTCDGDDLMECSDGDFVILETCEAGCTDGVCNPVDTTDGDTDTGGTLTEEASNPIVDFFNSLFGFFGGDNDQDGITGEATGDYAQGVAMGLFGLLVLIIIIIAIAVLLFGRKGKKK